MEGLYELTKKQTLFRGMVKNLVQKRVAPRVAEVDQSEDFPAELNQTLAQSRLLALLIPKENGGEGAGFLDFCLVIEEIGKVCPTTALICMLQNIGCRLILKNGSQHQKSYLPRMAGGQVIFGFALNEAASLDLATVPVEAAQKGEMYVLNGGPFFMANGDVAHIVIVFFRMNGSVKGLFIQKEKTPYAMMKTDGLTGSEARYGCKTVFTDCRVPRENLLGQESDGSRILADFVGELGCANAARSVGLAQGVLDYAIHYAKNRVQFGRPIMQFQAIQSLLAGMATKVEAARQLLYKAASLFDQAGKEACHFAAMAKYFASEVAMAVSVDGVQIAGGYGYMKDYPLEKMMRNAKLAQITEGTNQLQQLIIAKAL